MSCNITARVSNVDSDDVRSKCLTERGIFVRPDEVQPSGSLNFSRIDNATLVLTTKAGSVAYNDAANITSEDVTLANVAGNLTNLLVFAESYNILRLMSGIFHLYCKHTACSQQSAASSGTLPPMGGNSGSKVLPMVTCAVL